MEQEDRLPLVLMNSADGTQDDVETGEVALEEEHDVARPVLADGFAVYLRRSIGELFFGTRFTLLLVALPFAIIAKAAGWSDVALFTLSLIALCPLAERLGFLIDQLCLHINDTLGGLLTATFGNVPELIISISFLRRGKDDPSLLRLVQVSLIGSILSNLLLVLGSSFLIGGVRHPEQQFNKAGAKANSGLLMLVTAAVLFPTILDITNEGRDENASLRFSRFTSICLMLSYMLFLFFQLHTHRHVFAGEEDDDREEDVLGFWGSIFWLAVFSLVISFISDFMVDAIKGASEAYHVPTLFTGTIILPIVGNAAEHTSAIIFAWRNKMDVACGVAVGSSVQIAVSVFPLCVLVGWMIGAPLTLDVHIFEFATLAVTVIVVTALMNDGQSHWLTGILLLMVYIVIAVGYLEHQDDFN